ncbi:MULTISPECIES: acyl-ACP desaturase [Salegentibacter]|jgi:acyl-[acyl-carrier-protein] desaturase|uniref:Acyl-[acyl-carrier-protein] desaturase n=1 Tax=Salegentibacter agarivorans TaxID=345907 RepID=A0A1I2MAI2_9FLAO|nr:MULTISPECIES: acyl-ACP desaturase [Salegentibacter]APS38037.1 fatty acid desaturase [Salegentibacter sp. T436]MBO2543460.1 acyl-ACP desaturase [Salegentibacter sp. BDJ18]SFF88452.1 acyl-[acyl-carrier-protein] desaturase [Salegentibacter agarivorans]|tara:strand:- start:602 stop:1606 length:1005 start_codon:yes stop_codon:yes gene_type:complete
MALDNIRLEVMNTVEKEVDGFIEKYLIPVEEIWQPTDLLPNLQGEDYMNELTQIREEAKELEYDFWVVLVADMVTEEALPTYESWLMDMEGVKQHGKSRGEENAWSKWVRHWTGEENRHGDTLNKYLYLSGRVNMREIEKTTQHLINDGFDIGTGRDPYKNFVYTSFQELATNISHKRVGQLAKKKGNKMLGKMCNIIAGDEMRHYMAYREFVKTIFEHDPSQMMLAFHDMMKRKIVMPAQFLRESGQGIAEAFENFSNAAQRLGVYTTYDYIEILEKLNGYWEIDKMRSLTDEAEKARDYLMRLPDRMRRIADRMAVPQDQHIFKWVEPNGRI